MRCELRISSLAAAPTKDARTDLGEGVRGGERTTRERSERGVREGVVLRAGGGEARGGEFRVKCGRGF
jgi:hypothetical protein